MELIRKLGLHSFFQWDCKWSWTLRRLEEPDAGLGPCIYMWLQQWQQNVIENQKPFSRNYF